jgi:hypothetical protein
MKQSITDSWQKEEKVSTDGYKLTLFSLNGNLLGITFSAEAPEDCVNESWSYDACVAMEETGEMEFFEPDACPTQEQLRRWFDTGNSDFSDFQEQEEG